MIKRINWPKKYFDEFRIDIRGEEFKKQLLQMGLEKNTIQLNKSEPLIVPYELFLADRDETIDEEVYVNLKERLLTENLDYALDGIASLIKQLYVRKAQIIIRNQKGNQPSFHSEFYSLVNLLTMEIEHVRFAGIKKGQDCTITNPLLLKSILNVIKKEVLGKGVQLVAEFITVKELRIDNYLYSEKSVQSLGAFWLLWYIQTKTSFKYNVIPESAINMTLTNKQCELVYDLLCIGKIIEEKVSHSRKDLIRNLFKRFAKDYPELMHYFDSSKTDELFNFHILFYNVKYIQMLRKNIDKIRMILKKSS